MRRQGQEAKRQFPAKDDVFLDFSGGFWITRGSFGPNLTSASQSHISPHLSGAEGETKEHDVGNRSRHLFLVEIIDHWLSSWLLNKVSTFFCQRRLNTLPSKFLVEIARRFLFGTGILSWHLVRELFMKANLEPICSFTRHLTSYFRANTGLVKVD